MLFSRFLSFRFLSLHSCSTLTSWLPLTQLLFDKKPTKAIDLLEITRFTCQVRPRAGKMTILFFTT